MNGTTLRKAFVQGYEDALDAYSKPSTPLATKGERDAWQAGWNHWQDTVFKELERLRNAVQSGLNFPTFVP